MHHWPEATQDTAYDLLCNLWRSGHIPDWWRHKWLVPIPKKVANPTPADLRPIVLLEVLRKTWTSLLTGTIMDVLQKSGCLCPSQHAFQRRKGTDSASLQLINMLEEAHASGQPLYGSSWDIRKAFDTLSKPIIRLAWLRQGVPAKVVDWLLALDDDASLVVRSDWAQMVWAEVGIDGLRQSGNSATFSPDRGTGQGDVSSPATWVVSFDIVLCALARVGSDHHSFLLPSTTGLYRAPDIAFADDLLSPARTLKGLQRKADMMSLCAIILGLVIAIKKLRTFHIGRPLKVVAPAVLLVHMDGWVPQRVPIHTGGTLPFLGITHDLDLSGKSQYARATADLTHALEILAHSRASPACVLTVLRSSTISKVAYSAVLSPWSLTQLQEFDRLMAVIFRRLSSNMRSSQLENLFQPACKGGLGFPQPSAIFLERKQTVLERMPVVDMHTRLAVEGLQHRAHLRYDGTTPCTSTSRGLYMSAILAYAAQADIVRLAPCPLSAASELHTAVHSVGRLDKTAHRFCALHHIATVADLTDAQPDGVRCWSTRFHIPSSLQALLPLNPPHGSRPLCAGQFWRISPPLAPGQLLQVNDTIVELVEVPPYPSSAPIRYHLWHIPPLTPSHLPPNSPITRPSFTLGPPTATAHFDHLFPPSHLHHLVHVQPSTQACSFSSILLRRTLLALPEPRPHLPSPPIAPSPPPSPPFPPQPYPTSTSSPVPFTTFPPNSFYKISSSNFPFSTSTHPLSRLRFLRTGHKHGRLRYMQWRTPAVLPSPHRT